MMTKTHLLLLLLSGSFCAGQAIPAPSTDACQTGSGSVSAAEEAECAQGNAPASAGVAVPSAYGRPAAILTEPNQMPPAYAPQLTQPAVPSTRIAGPLTARSEFEQFAEDAAGRRLPVYGRKLFDEVPTTFAPMDRAPVPADYVLGPGDELLIRAWGKIDVEARVTVDRNGQIFLPRVGTLSVAGLRYEQLEGFLHTAIGRLYKDFELNVTMGRLRSIQIFVLGSARQPGVYTVGALSTLADALFACGGPSATGTMRRIQLRRGDGLVTEFDVYDLLRRGDKSHDVQLLSGDVIYIPPVGPQVAILGSVNEPGIYELKGETPAATALKDAGGLTNLAETDRALLERIENHRRRRVDEFPLDMAGLQHLLRDGDLLRIFPISPQFDDAVTLRGNVEQPGRFLWHEGMRIADLIPSRDVLITRLHWNQQNQLAGRWEPESEWKQQRAATRGQEPASSASEQNDGSRPRRPSGEQQFDRRPQDEDEDPPDADRWLQASQQRLQPAERTRSQDGQNAEDDSLERPRNGQQPAPDMMDDIVESSAEINWEYAAIERLDERDLSTRLIAFNLGNAIDHPDSADNQLLKAGDVVTIFSRKDLPLPQDKHAAFVRISGEVNAPGVYRVSAGQTLRALVEQAGGLTPHSYLYASQLNRVSTRLAEEQQLRLSVAQMQRDLTSRYAAANSLSSANTAEQQAQLSAQQAAIAQLAAVHPTGRIVLGMNPSASSVADVPDLPLEDGDSFYIPPRLSTIQVAGAVYNENAFRYQPGKRLSRYLSDAGGPTRQADIKRVFVIRADGTVLSRQSHSVFSDSSFESRILLPGDAIIVPTKLKAPGGFMQQLPFVTQILSQTAMTGAVLGTIY